MVSYAAVPLASKKVYVPIEVVRFFDNHPNADWDKHKNDIYCPEHNVSFNTATNLQPLVVNTHGVYYSGIDLPITHLSLALDDIELNREYGTPTGGCCGAR